MRVTLVESACAEMRLHFPDLWRLSQAYFSGELLASDSPPDITRQPQCKVGHRPLREVMLSKMMVYMREYEGGRIIFYFSIVQVHFIFCSLKTIVIFPCLIKYNHILLFITIIIVF